MYITDLEILVNFVLQALLVFGQIICIVLFIKRKSTQDIMIYLIVSIFLATFAFMTAELSESVLITFLNLELRNDVSKGVNTDSLQLYTYLQQYKIKLIKSLYLICSLFSLTFCFFSWLLYYPKRLNEKTYSKE